MKPVQVYEGKGFEPETLRRMLEAVVTIRNRNLFNGKITKQTYLALREVERETLQEDCPGMIDIHMKSRRGGWSKFINAVLTGVDVHRDGRKVIRIAAEDSYLAESQDDNPGL